jgi:hypothetical protein
MYQPLVKTILSVAIIIARDNVLQITSFYALYVTGS